MVSILFPIYSFFNEKSGCDLNQKLEHSYKRRFFKGSLASTMVLYRTTNTQRSSKCIAAVRTKPFISKMITLQEKGKLYFTFNASQWNRMFSKTFWAVSFGPFIMTFTHYVFTHIFELCQKLKNGQGRFCSNSSHMILHRTCLKMMLYGTKKGSAIVMSML